MPYAQPPAGLLRWRSPERVQPWTSLRNASKVGPGCPQMCNEPPGMCPDVMSEDCLYANIFTPRASKIPSNKLPVLVFIHGGSYQSGTGSAIVFEGSFLLLRLPFRSSLSQMYMIYIQLGWCFRSDDGLGGQRDRRELQLSTRSARLALPRPRRNLPWQLRSRRSTHASPLGPAIHPCIWWRS